MTFIGIGPIPGDLSLYPVSQASEAELAALSALCLRSKAHWGYDPAFIQACVAPLTISHAHLSNPIARLGSASAPLGVVCLSVEGSLAHLDKLFVAPEAMGQGAGRVLFEWATTQARGLGATKMNIESDPGAEPFYCAMGAKRIGEAASEAIPGRMLPLLQLAL